MAHERPGLSLAGLPIQLRNALKPVVDLVGRISGASLTKIKPLTGRVQSDLDSAATLAETIAARNADAEALRETRNKVNEIIARLQED